MRKLILLSIFYFLFFKISFSQPQFEWLSNYPMRGSAVAIDSSGNIYTVGYISDVLHILKYNTNGNLIWHRFDSLNTTGNGICAVADKWGNIYVTADGYSGPNGAYLRTLKYDSSGNKNWLRYCFATEAMAMTSDNIGNIYIAGTKTIQGRYNYITIKYNPQGDTLWTAVYQSPGSSGGSIASSIYVDLQYNVYITGGSLSTSNYDYHLNFRKKTIPVNGDYITVKYNSNGLQQWVAMYGGPIHIAGASSITVDKYGYIYVTGSVEYALNVRVIGTIKYTPNGDSVWTRVYFPPLSGADEYGNNILLDTSLNIYITGHGSDFPRGSNRILKYDNSGNLLWVVADTNASEPHSSILDKYSNIYLTGSSGTRFYSTEYNSSGINIWSSFYPPDIQPTGARFGIKILIDNSNNLFIYGSSLDSSILIKYGLITNIKHTEKNIITTYKLYQNYPNPFNPVTSIKYQVSRQGGSSTNMSFVVLKVYDVLGKEVETLVNEYKKAGTYETQFPGNQFTNNQLSSGIYFYSLFINDKLINTRQMIMIK